MKLLEKNQSAASHKAHLALYPHPLISILRAIESRSGSKNGAQPDAPHPIGNIVSKFGSNPSHRLGGVVFLVYNTFLSSDPDHDPDPKTKHNPDTPN